MKNSKYILLILILLLLLTACKKDTINPDNGHISEPDIEDPIVEDPVVEEPIDVVESDIIRERLDAMSLEEKIGQLLIIGFEDSVMNDVTKRMIEEYKIGGFILFARNIVDENQLLNLINDLKTTNTENPVPLFISIDEEGGKVSRLPKAFKRLPESKVLGDINNPDLSYEYGQLLGNRLNKVGINLNFAPVLDINSNPKNPVIGNRSFGSTTEVVIQNGISVLKGLESTGVVPAVKHFPGHGDTSVDSHANLPIVNKTLDELEGLELQPFKSAIEEDVDMIMVAHILFPGLDNIYPSTMSKSILTDLLRGNLGYNGVVISDDMTMGAIIENYTLEEAAFKFLKSGGDIALICHGQDNPISVINYIKDNIKNGEITVEEIDDKVYRILSLKNKYKLEDRIIENINLQELNKDTEELLNRINK